MRWYAVDALDEAFAETRDLLLPFDLGAWLRLAVITAFAGLSAPQTPTFSAEAPPEAVVEFTREYTVGEFVAAFALLGAALVAAAAVVAAVGAVMEFVLVDVARSRDVRVATPFRRWLGAGLRLLGFRLAVVFAGLLAVALVVAPVAAALLVGPVAWLALLVVTVPLAAVVGAASAVASEFTTAFVVPLMVDDGVGVVAGWRRLWPEVRADWRQFGVYVLVKAVLLFGASLALGFAVAVVAVPFGLGGLFVGAVSPLGALSLAVAAVVGLLAVGAVSVPTMTFLRYHSLAVLDRSAVAFSLR
ncbi:DUF7544 domain-containing protein [Halobacterium jilantaiense]|uniref:Membrane domain of glycerophosphoryl diester phosphodiesterase n=1 Tax=Halobacterium jilantaiense TaxID=355548 RepID=A0A1I0MYA6_9EURY|nr:hypothetical protein [Halobacterium jilantaiense]SEV93481.1 hypothetical protein SAMN04487945_0452 [Halobacterium jilantaiense]